MQRYKFKEFDVAAEQFLPGEGGSLPSGVSCISNGCWLLCTQKDWLRAQYPSSQKLDPGNWIVRTNRGQVYCISNEDFHNAFEKPA